MKTKKIAAYLLLVVGLIITSASLYYKTQLSKARHGVESLSGLSSGNPFGQAIHSEASSTIAGYGRTINLFLFGGIALTALGASYTYMLHKKR